jgi:predicted short-subunit dehydrogenase-like oxidoreductase (DUF2520 family)
MRVGFVGAGRLAQALAPALDQLVPDTDVVAVTARTRESAQRLAGRLQSAQDVATPQDVAQTCDLVVIATPDDVITSITCAVQWQAGQLVVHCSGAQSAALLDAAAQQGAITGVFHPLQTFAGGLERDTRQFTDITFSVEASEPLASVLTGWAQALGGRTVNLQAADRVLYHAAAVIACNYLVTLAKLATDLWAEMGIGREAALEALLPLIKGTVENLDGVGLPHGLTGPIARGDLGTIERHLTALAERAPHLLATYRELGVQTVPLAEEIGRITAERASALRELLTGEAAVRA